MTFVHGLQVWLAILAGTALFNVIDKKKWWDEGSRCSAYWTGVAILMCWVSLR